MEEIERVVNKLCQNLNEIWMAVAGIKAQTQDDYTLAGNN